MMNCDEDVTFPASFAGMWDKKERRIITPAEMLKRGMITEEELGKFSFVVNMTE
ncbi:MAG: hypothetical protein LBM39_02025 [Candidatus Methanoplasma sp.]|jgi:hypothetical protein|nr:hypothetical protein [Candidatus Methanoplasma sp.]